MIYGLVFEWGQYSIKAQWQNVEMYMTYLFMDN